MSQEKKIVAIIQARLASRRLPNKVLLELPPKSGVTVLERVIRAAKAATRISKTIVVFPSNDYELWWLYAITGARWYPGNNDRDLLKDYYELAQIYEADIIVRLTADCPLITSEIIDNMVKKFLDGDVDFMYNTSVDDESCRDGFDVEVFTRAALEKAYYESQYERQHVTTRFRTGNYKRERVEPPEGEFCSLDTEEDYEKICGIFENIK